MVNGIRIIYLRGFNKGFGLKFCVGSRIWHETPEQGKSAHQPIRCVLINEDDLSPNILCDKKNTMFDFRLNFSWINKSKLRSNQSLYIYVFPPLINKVIYI